MDVFFIQHFVEQFLTFPQYVEIFPSLLNMFQHEIRVDNEVIECVAVL